MLACLNVGQPRSFSKSTTMEGGSFQTDTSKGPVQHAMQVTREATSATRAVLRTNPSNFGNPVHECILTDGSKYGIRSTCSIGWTASRARLNRLLSLVRTDGNRTFEP